MYKTIIFENTSVGIDLTEKEIKIMDNSPQIFINPTTLNLDNKKLSSDTIKLLAKLLKAGRQIRDNKYSKIEKEVNSETIQS